MHHTYVGIDFATIAIFAFFGFFVMLILYLRREDRREGYPLEEDPSGRVRTNGGVLFTAPPKTFHQPYGWGDVTVPNGDRDRRPLTARRTSIVPGSPLEPTGNPMLAGVGPGSYAERARVPDVTIHGQPKIVPLRAAAGFFVAKGDPDPRGMRVIGTDGVAVGTVVDAWVDRVEVMIRYLEVSLGTSETTVLVPMTMAKINKSRRQVKVDAITAAQFADVPRLEQPDQITFYEEERVTAYYGAGFLYATPARSEPIL